MVTLLMWAMKKPMENSKLADAGHPKGAVALVVAGVHSNLNVFPMFADQCATRLSRPFKCFIQAIKYGVALFPQISWRCRSTLHGGLQQFQKTSFEISFNCLQHH